MALIVGIDNYSDAKLNRLRSPSEDVESLAAVLGDPAIGGFEVVKLV
ncbi:MAG: hypothetical protein INR72_20560, partial [Williamsia herbipolensis]|nr:hypothetical protein [Williamsia herbipolensis]